MRELPIRRVDDRIDSLVQQVSADDAEDAAGRYFFLREDFLRFGTFPPARRASESPMAIACLRLFTRLPERPLLSVPCLRLCIARFTLLRAFFPYLAMATPVVALLHFRFCPKPPDQLLDLVLHQLLLDARLYLGEGRKPHLPHIVELDDVVAEARADRRLGVLAFLELYHRVGELLVEHAGHVPVEVAAAVLGSRILGVLRRQVLELRALLQVRDEA